MAIQLELISPSRRLSLRLSMRGLIIHVLLIGAALGWMVRVVRPALLQRDAVAAIRNGGGRVSYRFEWHDWEAASLVSSRDLPGTAVAA